MQEGRAIFELFLFSILGACSANMNYFEHARTWAILCLKAAVLALDSLRHTWFQKILIIHHFLFLLPLF